MYIGLFVANPMWPQTGFGGAWTQSANYIPRIWARTSFHDEHNGNDRKRKRAVISHFEIKENVKMSHTAIWKLHDK